MPLTEPSARRRKPVRLTDLPLDVRYRAAVLAAKHADPEEAKALLAAAITPSATVYYVAAAA